MNSTELDELMKRLKRTLEYVAEAFPDRLSPEMLWNAGSAVLREAIPLNPPPDWAESLAETTLIDWYALLIEDSDLFESRFNQREPSSLQARFTVMDATALAEQLHSDSPLMTGAQRLAELLTAANRADLMITRLHPSDFYLYEDRLDADWESLLGSARNGTDRLLSTYELGWMHPALRKREIPPELTPAAATTHTYAYWILHTLTRLPPAANQASLLDQIERFRVYNPHLPNALRAWLRTWLRLPADSRQTPLECWQALQALVHDCETQSEIAIARHETGGESLFGRNKRSHQNEDMLVILNDVPGATLLAVADGVSTASLGSGGQASFTVRELAERQRRTLTERLDALAASDTWEADGWQLIEEFFENAHQAVVDKINSHLTEDAESPATAETMSSTLVLALVRGNRALIGHWGDSRAYRLSPQGVVRLTEDHNVEMEALLRSRESRYERSDQGAALVRVLGQCRYDPQTRRFAAVEQKVSRDTCLLGAEDWLLLCSDGLLSGLKGESETEKEQRLLALLGRHHESHCRELARQLSRAADDDKGDDNITAVLLRVIVDDDPQTEHRAAK
ncbi:hypothetical protein CKO25_19065 [Thiocapsa imhoffii]|uniref:PPM-type phosphatase domain-containing protein n=1 Tax=Thiocapsa imhoffii TaxID=382777 RepID=A0A9X1BBI7_9GAMM|nr:protein phosphatase 2C domain-containing protein [Thiocapsa imhoffii]MBK1646700.1 hypothetical protein [Thiocapsa imhoffii]